MLKRTLALCLMALLVSACAGVQPPTAPGLVKVHASSATYPWLERLYGCASSADFVVQLTEASAADLSLNFGAPEGFTSPAFQIGHDDLLVVVHPQTGVGPLTREQVRSLFAGQIAHWKNLGGADVPVQVWTYSPDEDIQAVFNGQVMQGEPIVSLARLAVSAQVMSDSVGANPGAIGLLPRRWKAGNTNVVFTIPAIPVLATTPTSPQGAVHDLIGCLQSAD